MENQDIISNTLRLRVEPPQTREDEYLAQDFFRDEAGRGLAFDGTRVLDSANNTLREVSERLGKKKVALHALIALANAEAQDFKRLEIPTSASPCLVPVYKMPGRIKAKPANIKIASTQLNRALLEHKDIAVESLGHIDYKYYVDRYSECLVNQDAKKEAAKIQDSLYQTMAKRKVLDSVLKEIAQRRASYEKGAERI